VSFPFMRMIFYHLFSCIVSLLSLLRHNNNNKSFLLSDFTYLNVIFLAIVLHFTFSAMPLLKLIQSSLCFTSSRTVINLDFPES